MISLISQTQNADKLNNTNDQRQVCVTPFKFASKLLKLFQDTLDEFMSKSSKEKIKKCLALSKKSRSISSQSLKYIRYVNNLFNQVNDLTGSGGWPMIRRTWQSISFLILNQQQQLTAATTDHLLARS